MCMRVYVPMRRCGAWRPRLRSWKRSTAQRARRRRRRWRPRLWKAHRQCVLPLSEAQMQTRGAAAVQVQRMRVRFGSRRLAAACDPCSRARARCSSPRPRHRCNSATCACCRTTGGRLPVRCMARGAVRRARVRGRAPLPHAACCCAHVVNDAGWMQRVRRRAAVRQRRQAVMWTERMPHASASGAAPAPATTPTKCGNCWPGAAQRQAWEQCVCARAPLQQQQSWRRHRCSHAGGADRHEAAGRQSHPLRSASWRRPARARAPSAASFKENEGASSERSVHTL